MMATDTTDALVALREEWEYGLTVCSVLPPTEGRQLVILSGLIGDTVVYHCHRYFEIAGNWNCSVDASNVPLQAVWEWLADPRALSLKRINALRELI